MKKVKRNYINNFPIIIMVIVAVLVIILANIYLSFKPFKTIYKNGYMVLSQNMTSNLLNNKIITEELNVGATLVNYGDPLYKQVDSYYVGIEEKREIDYDYPVYSADGLTIYSLNDNFSLINSNFERLVGYSGLYIDRGMLYNEGDLDPADDDQYIFYHMNNSVYINTQVMTIKTLSNVYTIPVNSPLYFNIKYLNYYTFDGEKFEYNRINDIYYDSIITIGSSTFTYEEFLLKLDAIKEIYEDEIETEEIPEEDDNKEENQDGQVFIKPSVSTKDFIASVYSIKANLSINDPNNTITMEPTFEVYKPNGKLHLRKKIITSGNFKIAGLSSNTEYKIVGKYKYKNEYGNIMVVTFFEGNIKTNNINNLEEIKLEKDLGNRYSDKIEVKNLTIKNKDIEAIDGVKKVVIDVWKINDDDKKRSFNLDYKEMSNLLKGESVTVSTSNVLESNTVYNYEIVFYDIDDNIINCSNNSGVVETSKQSPSVVYSSKMSKEANSVEISLATKNKDNVNIHNYKYQLLDPFGNIVKNYEGALISEDGYKNELEFKNLDYNTNYKLIVTGEYDLEDGNGIQVLYSEKGFTTTQLSNITAWIENEKVTYNSISQDVYISSKVTALAREDTKVYVYLTDADGNSILDENGNLKYYKEYSNLELAARGYYIQNIFEDLDSATKYYINLKIEIEQISEKIVLEKRLDSFITNTQDAYIEVKSKMLLGNKLNLSFNVVDNNSLIESDIGQKEVVVEIYEGNLEAPKKNSYIYRKHYELNGNAIEIELSDCSLENYTIFVIAELYDGSSVNRIIQVKEIDQTYSDYIKVSNNAKVSSEIQDQKYLLNSRENLITSVNVFHNVTTNLYVFDCKDGICEKLGYFYYNSFISSSPLVNNYTANFNGKNNLLIKNPVKEEEHTIYFLVEKAGNDLKKQSELSEGDLDSKSYIMNYLNYNTGYEIYNIDEAKDFFDRNLIAVKGDSKHYVVTADLDFNDSGTYLINSASSKLEFSGVIDFQGYSVSLYESSISNSTLFSNLGENAILRNAVLNYNLDYDGVIKHVYGFVQNNQGTIENFVVNVSQKYDTGRSNGLGLLSYINQGTIENFVVYLNSNIYTYADSSLVTFENKETGLIKNGYVATYSEDSKLGDCKIILYDPKTNHGTFTYTNRGTIKNVYNLVSVDVNSQSSYSYVGYIGNIVFRSESTGKVQNTVSVASTVLKQNNTITGMSLYLGYKGNVFNNYFVDLSAESYSVGNSFNTKINSVITRNSGFWNLIFNSDDSFNINKSGEYYPILNMSLFMNNIQKLISIEFDWTENPIDILSTSIDKYDIVNNEYIVNVEINNPGLFEIVDIKVADINSKIIEQQYDRDNQTTTIKLKLSLDEASIAKSQYEIIKLSYGQSDGDAVILFEPITYDEKNPRLIDVDIFRTVDDYESLIKYMNSDENIFILKDIVVNSNELPNGTYSAILDGNENYIDFKNMNINRNYFLRELTGTIKNLGIRNIYLKSYTSAGFILIATSAIIENVDINNVDIQILEQRNASNIYIGALIAESSNTSLNKVSINDIEITKTKGAGTITSSYIGGMIGYPKLTTIKNSYVYNLNAKNIYLSSFTGLNALGGIAGYLYYSDVENCYTTGNINSEQSYIGGISGAINVGNVVNNYSSMKISSTGDFVSGIIGFKRSGDVNNNLFIGQLENINNKPNYFSITSYNKLPNYVLNKLSNDRDDILLIKDGLLEFELDSSNPAFSQDGNPKNTFPYLINASFATQEIIGKRLSTNLVLESSIEYVLDDDCVILDEYKNTELYENVCAISANVTFKNSEISNVISLDGNLEVIKSENENGVYYVINPNGRYLNKYKLGLTINGQEEKEVINLDLSFYKHIKTIHDWNDLSNNDYNNALLLENIEIVNTQDSTSKKILNLLGNGKTISLNENSTALTSPIIQNHEGIMADVSFDDIRLQGEQNNFGIIAYSQGTIKDSNFSNIEIQNIESTTGIIAVSNGYVSNVRLDNVSIIGNNYVGGLIAVNKSHASLSITFDKITASNIYVAGKNYVGGIAGNIVNMMKDVSISNSVIVAEGNYIGGIAGLANVSGNSNSKRTTATDIKIYSKGSYIGGIAGYQASGNSKSYMNAIRVLISDDFETIYQNDFGDFSDDISNISERFYINIKGDNGKFKNIDNSLTMNTVGGIYGNGSWISYCTVKNLVIGNITEDSEITEDQFEVTIKSNLKGKNAGGISGQFYDTRSCVVRDSLIYGGNFVGGISGINTSASTSEMNNNIVVNSEINGTHFVGGLIGFYQPTISETSRLEFIVMRNMVLNSSVTAQLIVAGGLIGYLQNNTVEMQNIYFVENLFENIEVKAEVGNLHTNDGYIRINTAGGAIGYMAKVPQKSTTSLGNSLFYGTVENVNNPSTAAAAYEYVSKGNNLIGHIGYLNSSPVYGESPSIGSVVFQSNFRWYCVNDCEKDKISEKETFYDEIFISSIDEMKKIINSGFIYPIDNGKSYFPINQYMSPYINKEDYVEVPLIGSQKFSLRRTRSLSNRINIDYDIYATDVDKLNIEFSDTDSDSYFYYEIGDYKSELINIDERVYTITYDFKNSIKIHIIKDNNYKYETINADKLRKTLSLVNGKTYYINNGLLYGESKVITGNFVNLYENRALTSDGEIYDIETKQSNMALIDYGISGTKALYAFTYEGQNIYTYYNHSVVNSVVNNYQIILKNGIINVIDSNLRNKKDSYIIDYYNDTEYQIILKDTGVLYSLKNNIKTPDDFKNNDIVDLYTNIYSSSNIVTVKYSSGEVYTFNYRTGEKIFSNISTESLNFLDYLSEKLFGNSDSNSIEEISSYEKYKEIELLKSRIEEVSVDEAVANLMGNNLSTSSNKNYVTVYNEVTSNYDVYNVEELLKKDTPESENKKIYKNYELVQFYSNNKAKKRNLSLSGTVVFSLSILAVIGSLYLLINRARNKKILRGGV